MKQRTLKQVAEAGLALGFEWIAKDSDMEICLFRSEPKNHSKATYIWSNGDRLLSLDDMNIEVTDYDHEPKKSLLKLSDIVEVEDE